MFPSGSVALVMVAHLSHAVPSATCPILRENYREIESRLMSSLVHLMRCLMKADFARAMRGYASRPAKGECPKWVTKQTSRDVCVTSALPPIADIRRMSWHVRFVPIADISARLVIPCSSRHRKSGHQPSCRRRSSRAPRGLWESAATSRWSLLSFPRWHSA